MKIATIILSFYNDITTLKMALQALDAQYIDNFKVIIADDGSNDYATNEIRRIQDHFSFTCSHLWHDDLGFRKPAILNRAVQNSDTNYLIFLDADCVPQKHFVEDHLKSLEPGICQTGRRVDVFYEAIKLLSGTEPTKFFTNHWLQFTAWSLQKKAKNVERGIRLPSTVAQSLRPKPWSVVGCNFSVCKHDLIAINGFDERASVPWGAEDSDVERRLLKAGVRLKGLRYQAPVIHFDASFNKRGKNLESDQERLKIFLDAKAENRTWTRFGIIKEDRPDPVLYPPA